MCVQEERDDQIKDSHAIGNRLYICVTDTSHKYSNLSQESNIVNNCLYSPLPFPHQMKFIFDQLTQILKGYKISAVK